MKFYRRFNYIVFKFIAGSSLLLGGFNLAIDPYGVMNSPRIKGWNWSKPEQLTHARLFKAIALTRPLQLQTLLLGTSRVESALEPDSTALVPYQPAYNSALPASTMYEQFSYFNHAILNQKKLKLIIIGLDFEAFLKYNENASKKDFDKRILERLEKKGSGKIELLSINFSINTIKDSLETVINNFQNPNTIYYYPNGFSNTYDLRKKNSNIDYFITYTTWQVVRIIKNGKKGNFLSEQSLAQLQEIQSICKDAGMELKLFIPPPHVAYLEDLRLAKKWQVYEDWKREIVKVTSVWDFSGYNSITTEPLKDKMNNYRDGLHYSTSIGDLILNQLVGYQEEEVPEDFGVLITPENVEEHLENIRRDRTAWLENNPDAVELLQELKEEYNEALSSF